MTMVKVDKVDRKTTRDLYENIYLARIEGNSVQKLTKIFDCSKSTVHRAIMWCKRFVFEFPRDEELVKNMLADILNLDPFCKLLKIKDYLIIDFKFKKIENKKKF